MYPFFLKVSRGMAHLGGGMLTALIVLTCLSVLGRELNDFLNGAWMTRVAPGVAGWLLDTGIGPIRGDFELIEAGIAFSIFAFLPLCTIMGGHATVDIFTRHLSDRANRGLRLVTDVVLAAVLVLIAVQLFSGMLSKMRSGTTTFLLEFPIWWAYALGLVGAVWGAIVAIYIALMRLREALAGRDLLPADLGADH